PAYVFGRAVLVQSFNLVYWGNLGLWPAYWRNYLPAAGALVTSFCPRLCPDGGFRGGCFTYPFPACVAIRRGVLDLILLRRTVIEGRGGYLHGSRVRRVAEVLAFLCAYICPRCCH